MFNLNVYQLNDPTKSRVKQEKQFPLSQTANGGRRSYGPVGPDLGGNFLCDRRLGVLFTQETRPALLARPIYHVHMVNYQQSVSAVLKKLVASKLNWLDRDKRFY